MNRRGYTVTGLAERRDSMRSFGSLRVLLSEMKYRTPTKEENLLLIEEVSEKIRKLDSDLDKKGEQLRAHVKSHVETIAGSREDELSGMGLIFDDGKTRIVFEAGEADTTGDKISNVVEACLKVAESDRKFLKEILPQLESNSLPGDKVPKLGEILGNNTYWRFLEET